MIKTAYEAQDRITTNQKIICQIARHQLSRVEENSKKIETLKYGIATITENQLQFILSSMSIKKH